LTSCYDRACELLARRPHFRRELQGKLERRGYPPPEIAAALARLEGQGYLDDAAAARGLVASRLARGGGEGRSRLRAELERRGAAPAAVTAALDELPDDDLPAAAAAARRWEGAGRGRTPEALARHLARKGFSRRAIFALLKERPAGALEAPPEGTPDGTGDDAPEVILDDSTDEAS
jgi:regulatory protein